MSGEPQVDLFPSSTTAASDAELIRRYRRHDPQAAGEVYARYGKLLFGLILNIVGDRQNAEDLLTEVLLAASNGLHSFESNDFDFLSWLLILARNHALRFRGRRVRPKDRADSWKALENPALFEQPPQRARELVSSAAASGVLQALPEVNRLILELAWFEGMCLDEIASRLSLPVPEVVALAASSLACLREC